MDRIYTPESFADLLAGAAVVRPALVADFAAGEGALLKAARRRWPEAKAIAVDIDPAAVSRLQSDIPPDRVFEGDFLHPPAALEAFLGRIDLVLLNPPFSCRGNAWLSTEVKGEVVRCSRAMAFICGALPYLAVDGELVCIVPASCLSSEKDAAARLLVGGHFGVQILSRCEPAVFDGRAVSVALLRIVRGEIANPAWLPRPPAAEVRRLGADYTVVVGRGSTSVHAAKLESADASTAFVHTTDLKDGVFTASMRRSNRRPDLDGSAAVLLPRVGRPSLGKLVLVEGGPLVLSDCLFWLHTEPPGRERDLIRVLTGCWEDVAALYGGSCAPYTTLAEVASFLGGLGFATHIRRGPPTMSEDDAGKNLAQAF